METKELEAKIARLENKIQRLNQWLDWLHKKSAKEFGYYRELREDRRLLREYAHSVDVGGKLKMKRTPIEVMLFDTELYLPSEESDRLTQEYGDTAKEMVQEIIRMGNWEKDNPRYVYWSAVLNEIENPSNENETVQIKLQWEKSNEDNNDL